ncbi:hypothetical protein HanLR1_Chr17g0675511 [Helianthus annuus]|nr:hypothetical protein HanLR1_Chr17g0675511 [Helianthus annuus]
MICIILFYYVCLLSILSTLFSYNMLTFGITFGLCKRDLYTFINISYAAR